MDDDQQFCLRWNNHQSTLISVFDTLLENETLVDCTLAAEGKFLKAHKVVLSACSPYFATLLSEQYDKHPIFILKDVKYQELRAMMDYMYRGEVNISQDQLAALLKAAESLQIKGLSDNRGGTSGLGVGGSQQQKSDQHKHISVPGKLMAGSAVADYTLEQAKRSRVDPSSNDSQDMSGSREGSSSPTSRRRKKVRRRSIQVVLADNHENSNSSQIIQSGTSIVPTTNASGAITAMVPAVGGGTGAGATSAIPGTIASTVATSSLATAAANAANIITANVTKKTESVKMGNTDAMNAAATAAENIEDENAADSVDKEMMIKEKHNHKRSKHHHHDGSSSIGKDEIVIEPKSEYDDEGNDETVEDLTLDDEEMGLEDLDHNAGPSHGGEGSSQGYAQWQVDRSQDEVFMAAQEAQQRDPQETTSNTLDSSTNQKTAQTESRIRVRNWLMLADQSILQNSIVNHSSREPGGGSMTGPATVAGSELRRRQSMRLKPSPYSSPTHPLLMKYEAKKEDDEYDPSLGGGSGICSVGGGCDDVDDDNQNDDDNEQPCDLRLSTSAVRKFKELVSIAQQQQLCSSAAMESLHPTSLSVLTGQSAVLGTSTAGGGIGGVSSYGSGLVAGTIAAVSSSTSNLPVSGAIVAGTSGLQQQQQQQQSKLHQLHLPSPLLSFPTIKRSGSFSSGTSAGTGAVGIIAGGSSSGVVPSSSGATGLGTSFSGSSSSGGAASMIGAGTSAGNSGGGNTTTGWGGAYTCDRCGNSYARPHSLNRHVRFECGVEPKFECPICHKKSKHKHNLVLHMRTHQNR